MRIGGSCEAPWAEVGWNNIDTSRAGLIAALDALLAGETDRVKADILWEALALR